MILALLVFFLGAGAVIGAYALIAYLPGMMARRELDRRLRDVSTPFGGDAMPEAGIVKRVAEGPLPAFDKIMSRTQAGSWLARLIEQSGTTVTPSAIIVLSLFLSILVGFVALMFVRVPLSPIFGGLLGAFLPFAWLRHRRSSRMKKFEEQFPEALDLLSRAIRAGHAFQTAMGMVAEELKDPVGPEFKKAFEQQNFGLPLKEALNNMSDRMPLLDVRFFVTAVVIQRETGGNLSEILDNLAHVVRERFKILRQVRVHTAHGRFTGWVLLALPATLAVALSFIAPDQMNLLFREHMGQVMITGAIVMQTVGYLWIRQVIKIEV
jgi:tight adherence protein B